MSEEDLELLIALDDPVEAPEEDIFDHHQADKAKARNDQRTDDSGGTPS